MKGFVFISVGSECNLPSDKLAICRLMLSAGVERPYFSLLEDKGQNNSNSFSVQLFFLKFFFLPKGRRQVR